MIFIRRLGILQRTYHRIQQTHKLDAYLLENFWRISGGKLRCRAIGELEEIYPTASSYAKEDEEYRKEALHATYLLQNGHRGYRAVWNHIMNVSVTDLKKNYERLNVNLIFWKGEADAQKYIPDMGTDVKEKGYAALRRGRSCGRCSGRVG